MAIYSAFVLWGLWATLQTHPDAPTHNPELEHHPFTFPEDHHDLPAGTLDLGKAARGEYPVTDEQIAFLEAVSDGEPPVPEPNPEWIPATGQAKYRDVAANVAIEHFLEANHLMLENHTLDGFVADERLVLVEGKPEWAVVVLVRWIRK